jgi:hypothetical protein
LNDHVSSRSVLMRKKHIISLRDGLLSFCDFFHKIIQIIVDTSCHIVSACVNNYLQRD